MNLPLIQLTHMSGGKEEGMESCKLLGCLGCIQQTQDVLNLLPFHLYDIALCLSQLVLHQAHHLLWQKRDTERCLA
jgi:hypothetical protein